MIRWPILIATLVWGWGCGTVAAPQDPPAFKALEGNDMQQALAAETAAELQGLIDVDTSRVTVRFMTTWEEQNATCKGFSACTSPQVNGYLVNTYWPEGWEVGHAYMLAHELCHVFYFQTGEGGDPSHTHSECFGRPDVTGPASYGGGEGYAWQAAQSITARFRS